MEENKVIEYLRTLSLSEGLTHTELIHLASVCSVHQVSVMQNIITEGEHSSSIYVILDGQVEVLKFNKSEKMNFHISDLFTGDYVGEMSFFDNEARSTSVKAKIDSQVIEISKEAILQRPDGQQIFEKIKFNIVNRTGFFNRLRNANNTIVKTLQKEKDLLEQQNQFGNFFIVTVLQTAIVILVNHFIAEKIGINNHAIIYSHWFLWSYLFLAALPCLTYIIISHQKISSYGVSFSNWRQTLKETSIIIFFSILLFIFINHMKWLAIPDYFTISFFTYLLHSTIQEFILRGVMQTSLDKFYAHKHKIFSILITSFVFGLIHIHFGLIPVFITFLFGILLGFIFQHQKNIFGVSIIHAVFGYLAFNINLV